MASVTRHRLLQLVARAPRPQQRMPRRRVLPAGLAITLLAAATVLVRAGIGDAEVQFTGAVIDANPAAGALIKKWGDINGDGIDDAVIGTQWGVYWYRAPSSRVWSDPWTRTTIYGQGFAYEDAAVLDVNGDGFPDVVMSIENSLQWFQHPGGNGTGTWTQRSIASGIHHDLALGDLDGDGRSDLAASRTNNIAFGTGSGFTTMTYAPVGPGGEVTDGVALLDIGGGARNIVRPDGDSLVFFENPRETGGNARTQTWVRRVIAPNYLSWGSPSVATADINGDGRQDVISAPSENVTAGLGGLIWWEAPVDRRNGTWIKHTIDPSWIDVHRIDPADIDRNGTVDLVLVEQEQSPTRRVGVLYNDGAGNFTAGIIDTLGGQNPAVTDFDRDGDVDFFTSNHGVYGADRSIRLYVNGAANVPTTTTTQPTTTSTTASTTTTSTTASTTTSSTTSTSTTQPTTTTTAPPASVRFEAEDAAHSSPPVVETNWGGYTGTGLLGNFRGEGQYIRWTVPRTTAGQVNLTFRYTSANTADTRALDINGTRVAPVTFPRTTTWTDWRTVTIPATLAAGSNTITLTWTTTAGSGDYVNLDSLTVATTTPTTTTSTTSSTTTSSTTTSSTTTSSTTTSSTGSTTTTQPTTTTTTAPRTSTRYEAELAARSTPPSVQTQYSGYTGTGYLGGFQGEGQYIRWTVSAPRSGSATITFRYAAGSLRDVRALYVNGVQVPVVTFAKSTSWTNWRTVSATVNLVAGSNNTVELRYVGAVGSRALVNVDSVTVTM